MAAALDRPLREPSGPNAGDSMLAEEDMVAGGGRVFGRALGAISLPGLARHLGRTVNAIKVRAFRLGLGGMLSAGDYVTFNQLMLTLTDNAQSLFLSDEKLGEEPRPPRSVPRG